LTIIKTAGLPYVFGGFTTMNWSGKSEFKFDQHAFLFSLINEYNKPVKINIKNPEQAIFVNELYGPSFGSGMDIFICDQSNSNPYSFSNFGFSYQSPDFVKNTNNFLAGSFNFQAQEIEVYHINYNRKYYFYFENG
jgi:hypothetical protein